MTTLQLDDIRKLLIRKAGYALRQLVRHGGNGVQIKRFGETSLLVDSALFVATQKFSSSEEIYKEANALINEWVREEGLGDAQRDYQRTVYRPPTTTVVEDVFTLPWGQRIDDAVINSGITNSAIEPKAADAELMQEDSARELFKLLDKIYRNWGPQALGWIVLLNMERSTATYRSKGGSTITDVMRQIGLDPKQYSTTENTALQRVFQKIFESIKENR